VNEPGSIGAYLSRFWLISFIVGCVFTVNGTGRLDTLSVFPWSIAFCSGSPGDRYLNCEKPSTCAYGSSFWYPARTSWSL